MADEGLCDIGSQRRREPIALAEFAAKSMECRQLLLGFYSLCYGREAEVVRERYNGACNLYAARIRGNLTNERAVHFEEAQGEPR